MNLFDCKSPGYHPNLENLAEQLNKYETAPYLFSLFSSKNKNYAALSAFVWFKQYLLEPVWNSKECNWPVTGLRNRGTSEGPECF